MLIQPPRRIFQLDGVKGGILSIAERPDEALVLLVISQGETEAQLALDKESFWELADLKYSLRFSLPEKPQADPAFRVVA